MFGSVVQPALVSVFSSIGSHPLQLFSVSVDHSLPADSAIHFLHDHTNLPPPKPGVQLVQLPEYHSPESSDDRLVPQDLACTVLHIQSPTIQTTFIRCPPYGNDARGTLGLTHQWLHIQLRDLGREFSFEIGLTDTTGRAGIFRCSTFQVRLDVGLQPLGEEPQIESLDPPLLHVPLDMAPPGCMSPWRTIAINLSTVIPHFGTATGAFNEPRAAHIPPRSCASISYLEIYANCQLRYVWLARSADGSANLTWFPSVFEKEIRRCHLFEIDGHMAVPRMLRQSGCVFNALCATQYSTIRLSFSLM
ncbi:unnamed protein product [Rhizoctonia solani]|uniref:CFA20 domain-containing protein n=1 Tax=Rhizoctonia solani TaxID=456999 RepID=A0A8H3C350_9AGAM|nr:unnamed protein product [Rhizoctonia solani]